MAMYLGFMGFLSSQGGAPRLLHPILRIPWIYPDANHGAGICSYICAMFRLNVGKYSSTMEHLG